LAAFLQSSGNLHRDIITNLRPLAVTSIYFRVFPCIICVESGTLCIWRQNLQKLPLKPAEQSVCSASLGGVIIREWSIYKDYSCLDI
jgi:hypothetical protein